MTLLVVLTGKDGIVLAADSRGTFGNPLNVTAQNDTMVKAKILSTKSAVLIAGSTELGANIVKELQTGSVLTNANIYKVMQKLREVARKQYGEWFSALPAIPNPKAPARPDVVFLVAGYENNEPRIYQLASSLDFAPQYHEYGWAVAGVPQYALYLLNRLYEKDRSRNDLAALATYVITETASQDGKVGGPVQIIEITPDNGCASLETAQIELLIDGNHKRSTELKTSFYSSIEE